jgi:hypothetical protein
VRSNYWIVILLVFVIAYLVGTKYPSTGTMVLAKVGL